jgi:hypothetical protein
MLNDIVALVSAKVNDIGGQPHLEASALSGAKGAALP